MRDSGSPRRSGSESGMRSDSAPDDDKYNKPRRPDAEERLWLGKPGSVFQAASGMILSRFEDMLQKHVVVTLFLTMLVGAGGNAGNQSTVNIIRGLATGQVNNSNASSVVLVEAKLGLALGVVLAMLGWARVMISDGDTVSAMAIGASVFCIVATSTVVGAALPILLHRSGLDAAHAGPAIQVLMDIVGVSITCLICAQLFSYFGVH